MKRGLALLMFAFAAACAPSEMAPRATDDQDNSGPTNNATPNNVAANNGGDAAVARGGLLYDTYCLACHGPEGTGAATWSGNIQGFDPIYAIVKNGRGTMPPVAILSDAQISDVQAYLNSFVETGTNNAQPLTALQKFTNTCAPCHGPEGAGAEKGPPIQFPSRAYATWVTRNGRAGTTAGFPGPMSGYSAETFSDAELNEIFDFLDSQTRPTTGEALYVAFCGNCHGTDSRQIIGIEPVFGRPESVEEVVRVGHGGTNYGARTVYMPSWPQSALSDAEVILIRDYIASR